MEIIMQLNNNNNKMYEIKNKNKIDGSSYLPFEIYFDRGGVNLANKNEIQHVLQY